MLLPQIERGLGTKPNAFSFQFLQKLSDHRPLICDIRDI